MDEKLDDADIWTLCQMDFKARADEAMLANAVSRWLSQGGNPDIAVGGRPALNGACDNGSLHLVNALLKGGANPDIHGMEGRTPLHEFGTFARLDIAVALISAGANPLLENDEGSSALQFVMDYGVPEDILHLYRTAAAQHMAKAAMHEATALHRGQCP